MGARRPTAKSMVLAKDREREALDLRKAGATYLQISERIGITTEGARRCVGRALSSLTGVCAEKASELRVIEAERLDVMTLGLWDKARRGDIAAVSACLRIMDRRARLLGLDVQPDDDNPKESRTSISFVLEGHARPGHEVNSDDESAT